MQLPPFAYNPQIYLTGNFMVLDFETTLAGSAVDMTGDVVLACWYVCDHQGNVLEAHSIRGDEYCMQSLLLDIERVDFVVAQGAKFEAQWLRRCGKELRELLVWCTVTGQWVLDGNIHRSRKLNSLAQLYGLPSKVDLVAKMWATGLETDEVPPSILEEYCWRDVDITLGLFLAQRQLLRDRGQLHLMLSRSLTCVCLADIEFNGMTLDPERVQKEYTEVADQLAHTTDGLSVITGGINTNSPKQLGVFLYETLGFPEPVDRKGKPLRTPSGGYNTRADIVYSLKASSEEQLAFSSLYKKHNRLSTLMSKCLSFFWGVCQEYGGNFKAVFNQNVTKTHRLSSSGRKLAIHGSKKDKGVQLQNVPREYKGLFYSGHDDYVVGEGDGAQLEFRVAVDLCRDPVGLQEIVTGVDVHAITAEQMTLHGEPTTRQEAKARTFRPLYGGTSGTPAEVAYIEFFHNKYRKISETQGDWALSVVNSKEGELVTPYGMRFFWPGTRRGRNGRVDNSTNICNFPVQGFATAEIIPIGLFHFWHKTAGMNITIINTIHDSIISLVHKDLLEEYKELTRQCLTDDVYSYLRDVYNYDFQTPLGAGVKLARNWADTSKEVTYNVFPDGSYTIKEKN